MVKVKVEGISLKGKNRVREHGEIWECREISVGRSNELDRMEDKVLIQSLKDPLYMRWVDRLGDPHLKVYIPTGF